MPASAFIAQRVDRTEAADIDVAATRRNFLLGAFRQRTRLGLFRIAGLRRLPGRPVPGHQGGRAAARHCRDRAHRLVAARRADRHLRAAGRRLCRIRRRSLWMPVEAIMVGLLVASLPFFSYVAGHLNNSSLMLLSFRTREGRADRRARDGEIDVGRSPPPRRGGQPRQVALPRLDEPRAAHAAQRHPRLLRGDGQRGAGADGQPDLSRLRQRHPRFRPASARPDQRDPRPVAHRGRPLPAQRGAGDAARTSSRIAAT